MPVPFAPLIGFVLGVVIAWMAREELAKDQGPLLLARPTAIAAALGALVYAPALGYFAAFHGDWSYLYLVPHERVPSAVDLALVLASAAAVPGGVFAAAPSARGRKLGPVAWLGAAPLAVAGALFAWGSSRLAVSATYAQFHGNYGVTPLSSSVLGRGLLWTVILWSLAAVWTGRSLGLWESTKERTRPLRSKGGVASRP